MRGRVIVKFEYKLEGFEEMQRLLKAMPDATAKKVVESAVRVGANTLKKYVQMKAPVYQFRAHARVIRGRQYSRFPGQLSKSIIVRRNRDVRYPVVAFFIAVKKSVFWAHMVEFGTKAHKITVTKGTKLLADYARGMKFGRTVNHPGATAQPFFRPGLDEGTPHAMRAMAQQMAKALKMQAEKLAGIYQTKKRKKAS